MPMWNPWRGCKRCSEGCAHCYIHKDDAKRGVDTSEVIKTKDFYKPIEKLKNGGYIMKAGLVDLGFSTFANAERTLLRMAGSISFKQRTCVLRRGRRV